MLAILSACGSDVDVHICYDPAESQVAHAATKIALALTERDQTVETCGLDTIPDDTWTLVFETSNDSLPPDAFQIYRDPELTNRIHVDASGQQGAMYGGLAIAEDLNNDLFLVQVADREESPIFAQRVIEFESAGSADVQAAFWERFLDMMAANRFNRLVLPNAPDSIRVIATQRGIDVYEIRGGYLEEPHAASRPFHLRWGDPEFIRETLRKADSGTTDGFLVFTDPLAARNTRRGLRDVYTFEDHWLFYKLWGRLMYNPETPDEVFRNEFDRRYGIAGMTLFDAYSLASRMAVQLELILSAGAGNRTIADGMVRATNTDTVAFITVDDLINAVPRDSTYISVTDYIGATEAGRLFRPEQITPHELADGLERDARRALVLIESIEAVGRPDLEYELGDISAWSYLGLYLAEKIRGAIALHKYRTSDLTNVGELAVQRLEKAAEYWEKVVTITQPLYNELPIRELGAGGLSYSWDRVTVHVKSEAEAPGTTRSQDR